MAATSSTSANSSNPGLRPHLNAKFAGYPATASIMGRFPEMAIFKTFKSLGALDLLYQQADIRYLYQAWKMAVAENTPAGGISVYDTSIAELGRLRRIPDESKQKQNDLWEETIERLSKYCTAGKTMDLRKTNDDDLLRYQKICNLPSVSKHNMEMLHLYMHGPDHGAEFAEGIEADIYGASSKIDDNKLVISDLASIVNREEEDLLTKLVRGPLAGAFHRFFGIDRWKNVQVLHLSTNTIDEFPYKNYTTVSSTVLAGISYSILTSLLVMAAILTLGSIQSFRIRIVLILVYNLLFTVAMAFSVRGSPKDFFGVAAAYAAVLVVFANNPSSPGSSTPS